MDFVVLVAGLEEGRLAVEDILGVAVMAGSRSLAELKGHPGVGLAQRRTAGCLRVSRSVR
jgi:hypothetical protein